MEDVKDIFRDILDEDFALSELTHIYVIDGVDCKFPRKGSHIQYNAIFYSMSIPTDDTSNLNKLAQISSLLNGCIESLCSELNVKSIQNHVDYRKSESNGGKSEYFMINITFEDLSSVPEETLPNQMLSELKEFLIRNFDAKTSWTPGSNWHKKIKYEFDGNSLVLVCDHSDEQFLKMRSVLIELKDKANRSVITENLFSLGVKLIKRMKGDYRIKLTDIKQIAQNQATFDV